MTECLRKYSRSHSILCLQETHGEPGETETLITSALPHWSVFASGCVNPDSTWAPGSGGAAIVLAPSLASRCSSIDFTILVPGRCVAACLCIDSMVSNRMNIHNFNLSHRQLTDIGRLLSSWRDQSLGNPQKFVSFVVGDLNFPASFDRAFKPLCMPEQQTPEGESVGLEIPVHYSTMHYRWKSILQNWTELVQPLPTHFNPQGPTLKRLDRAWVDMPAHLITKIQLRSEVLTPPEVLFAQHVSDHAPVSFRFGVKTFHNNAVQPIPKFVVAHPLFQQNLMHLVDYVKLFELPAHKLLSGFNKCISLAAQETRNQLLLLDCPDSHRMVLASIARTIWANDVKLARKLLHYSELAREYLAVNSSGSSVSCTNFNEFFACLMKLFLITTLWFSKN